MLFYSFRIFLNVPAHRQNSLFGDPLLTKEVAFKAVFNSLEANHKDTFNDYGTEHVVYNIRRTGEDIYLWQLAKKQNFEKPTLGTTKIEDVTDSQFPFVYFFFDVKRQMAMIQHKTTVFQAIDTAKNKIEKYLTEKLYSNQVSVTLSAITDKREFWHKVGEMDLVEEVEFDYNPPNFFHGQNAVDDLVDEVHEETNFKKLKIYIENKVEGLTFNPTVFTDHIQRLASGAGSYVVKGIKAGFNYVIRSIDVPVSKQIDNPEEETDEAIEKKFDDVDKINDGQ